MYANFIASIKTETGVTQKKMPPVKRAHRRKNYYFFAGAASALASGTAFVSTGAATFASVASSCLS